MEEWLDAEEQLDETDEFNKFEFSVSFRQTLSL